MCKLDNLLSGVRTTEEVLCVELERIDWEALEMPVFDNQVIEMMGCDTQEVSNGSEAEAIVTASGDLNFESILEVEGFLENSVFETEEITCGSSSTHSPG